MRRDATRDATRANRAMRRDATSDALDPRDATRRDETRRDATRSDATQRDRTRSDATRRDATEDATRRDENAGKASNAAQAPVLMFPACLPPDFSNAPVAPESPNRWTTKNAICLRQSQKECYDTHAEV